MRFYGKVIGGVVLIIVALLLLQHFGEQKPSDSPPAPVSEAVATPALPAPTASPVPANPAPSGPSLPSALTQNAQRQGFRIGGSRLQDDWWYVTVIGRDRNHLNDFLDVAQRSGLKNIDHNYQAYKQFIAEGRVMFQNTYKMRF
jgi:hypothetical protein